jgi:hypothetical protein
VPSKEEKEEVRRNRSRRRRRSRSWRRSVFKKQKNKKKIKAMCVTKICTNEISIPMTHNCMKF